MGWLSVLIAAAGAFLLHRTGHSTLMIIAIVAAIGCFWSWGIMHNFATEAASRRLTYTGGFYDIAPQEAAAAPDWVTAVNMLLTLVGLVLLITGIVFLVRQ